MPRLRSISTTRYRSFARRTTLELRPLTLIYGGNSAGKSALLRLVPLLADSVGERASSPIDLSGPAGNKAAYRDIVWKGPVEGHRDLEVGLAWDWDGDDASGWIDEARYRIRYADARRQPLVEELTLLHRGDVQLVAQRIPESRERSGAPLVYEVTERGRTRPPEAWTFTGLIPSAAGDLEPVKQLGALLAGLRGRTQWIQSIRHPPEGRNPERGTGSGALRPDGSDACHALRAEVSAWYEAHAGRCVELRDAPPSDYRVLLRPLDAPAMDVDLVDAGEGFIQVFPVLTGLSLARRHAADEPFYLAMEEPESHLHSDRQVALARTLCDAASSNAPPIMILETHASQLMLALQIEVAGGRLPQDRVIIYWIEQLDDGSSIASRVTLDDQGHPEGAWPPGVFADQRRLAMELQRVQSVHRVEDRR